MKYCYLCGVPLIKNVNKSDDHVPPKCFFPPGTRGMITVLCCKKCNKEYDPLDDKIRNHIATLVPMLSEPVEKGRRAIKKSLKLEKEFLSHLKPHPTLLDTNGRNRLLYYFNNEELTKWLSRIVKGLYFHENRQRLSDEAIFEVKPIPEIQPQPSHTFPLENGLKHRPYFIYKALPDEKDPKKNYWFLIFYDQLIFMVTVYIPKN